MKADAWSALATGFAAIVALGLGVVAERRSRAERSERTKRERYAQAQQVSAWLEDRKTPPLSRDPQLWSRTGIIVEAFALNASDEPVWDVDIYSDELVPGSADVDHPDAWRTRTEHVGMIPPGQTVVRRLDYTPPDADSPAPLAMTFRDNAGQWWCRDQLGLLGGPAESVSLLVAPSGWHPPEAS